MRNTLMILIVCVGLQHWTGCGEDKVTNEAPKVPHYSLSGTVFPYYYGTYGQYEARNVTLVFVDSELDTVTVITDSHGDFEVTSLARGRIEIAMFSTDTVFTDVDHYRSLLHYLPMNTAMNLTQDTAINLQIRRLEAIFADVGYNPELWQWEYGVRNEEGKYIFWYDIRGSDMRMASNVHVPEDIVEVGFILLGEAAPSFTSTMEVYLDTNGVRLYPPYSTAFTATESYWIQPLPAGDEGSEGVRGDDIRLELEFQRYTADFIYIRQIFLYIY